MAYKLYGLNTSTETYWVLNCVYWRCRFWAITQTNYNV